MKNTYHIPSQQDKTLY